MRNFTKQRNIFAIFREIVTYFFISTSFREKVGKIGKKTFAKFWIFSQKFAFAGNPKAALQTMELEDQF